ncbi:glycosyltransferase family 1 protein [Vibrio sp. TH_r3]|uniref:glycosyltransferase family 4 protein n=1 Tax=Vibrio sp. TH_r3 TaxID=3082084 RepID=UPI0029559851|nr:glycosyltransferase family 1 protein [Vibrio sp. TH_r3]MDV7104215.1 glycosyltransferase family 1 protein [Vibrio sp. TH_r3]
MQNKLLINVSPIRRPLTGIGYYTLNILIELLSKNIEIVGVKNGSMLDKVQLGELVEAFSNPEPVIQKPSKIKRSCVELLRNIPGVYSLKNKLLSIRSKRTLKFLAEQGYIYFEPSFIPFDYNGKTITTIHDLSFISHPEFHPVTRVDFLKDKIKESINKSDHIIVDSHFILMELNSLYPATKSNSSCVYLGVAKTFKHYPVQDCVSFLSSHNIGYNKFILSVATLEPRKNLQQLVRAYKLLPEETRRSIPLVLVGDQGWKNSELFDEAKNLIDKQQIIFTGYVSDSELRLLYASAKLFVYPSLYEGFGLPVIEAMASGVAVITSNIGATAEVANNSAMLVDPNNISEIRHAMAEVISNQQLREKLVADGLARAEQFSWENTAREILERASAIQQ